MVWWVEPTILTLAGSKTVGGVLPCRRTHYVIPDSAGCVTMKKMDAFHHTITKIPVRPFGIAEGRLFIKGEDRAVAPLPRWERAFSYGKVGEGE